MLAAACVYLIYSIVISFRSTDELVELRIPSVEDLPPAQASFERYEIVGERNLFESRETAPLPPPPPEEEIEESQLRLRLLGTIAGWPAHLSVATVEDETSREHLHLRVDDYIGDTEDVQVVRIERMKLVLNNRGSLEAITMEEPDTTTRPARAKRRERTSGNQRGRRRGARSTERAADQRERLMERVNRLKDQKRQTRRSRQPAGAARSGANAKNLLEQVRFAPSFDSDGQLDGIQVTEVLPGPLQESGLQSGDVIVSVNGVAISGPNDLPKILPSLAEGQRSCLDTKGPNGRRGTHCWDN